MQPTNLPATVMMLLSFLIITPAYGADWVYVASSKSGSSTFYDAATVQRSAGTVTIWEKRDAAQDKTVKYNSMITLARYHCALREKFLISVTLYYPDATNETVEFPPTLRDAPNRITPGSVDEAVLEAVCK